MAVGPAGLCGGLVVNKSDPHGAFFSGRKHLGKQAGLFFLRSQFYIDGVLLLLQDNLLPYIGHQMGDLRGGFTPKGLVAIDLDDGQHSVSRGGGELLSAMGLVGPAEGVVGGGKVPAVILGPGLVWAFAHQLLQLKIAARLGKFYIVNAAEAEKISQLVIKLHFPSPVVFGKDADHIGADHIAVKELQYADSLVALLDIVAVHVFIDLDGVPDPFLHMGLTQGLPLGGKLRVLLQQRHEVPGKGVGPHAGTGADHKLQGNLEQPQIHSSVQPVSGYKVIQNGEIGIFSPGGAGPKFLLGAALGFLIIKIRHDRSPFPFPFFPGTDSHAGREIVCVPLGFPWYLCYTENKYHTPVRRKTDGRLFIFRFSK